MGRHIISKPAKGQLLVCEEGLSFWGGVDPANGVIIDAHHPQYGKSLAGCIVMMPTSRGSCSGSGVLLELALNGHAPAALIFREEENILTLGALVATYMFDRPLCVIVLWPDDYEKLAREEQAWIENDTIKADDFSLQLQAISNDGLDLTREDRAMLDGKQGEARKQAMEMLCIMASVQGAKALLHVTRAHIDGCIYASPANLVFAEKMVSMGAQVQIPTTMNAISVDRENWQMQRVPDHFGLPASRLADAYVKMGALPSFTCAPYQNHDRPTDRENIGWSESNAVIYANSILGARTVKHPDFLDLFIALTGRAPLSGVYLDENRQANIIIEIDMPETYDDSIWPLIGWKVGQLSPDRIPLLTGLDHTNPTPDDLRALCAAFGTTSAAPMLHIAGITPEGNRPAAPLAEYHIINTSDLLEVWTTLNSDETKIDLVALGSPHFSLDESIHFADLIKGHQIHPDVYAIITLSRQTKLQAKEQGALASLEEAGVKVITDLCWCSISEPVFPQTAQTVMTNSGKYAHYGPGLSGRNIRFGGLTECAYAARYGLLPKIPPDWLKYRHNPS